MALPPIMKRVFFITGSTDGIGAFTASELAKQGATVLVHGRNPAKVDNMVKQLQQLGAAQSAGFVADLSSLADVRRLGDEVKRSFPIIHGLLNNAGTFAGDYTGKRQITKDGNEYSLAVNVLAPFLLTSMLLPNVQASGAGRIIITSSGSAGSNEMLSDLQCTQHWSDHTAYELSKLCDAMMTMEMHKRYADPPRLTFHTMDPGTIDTKMLRAGWCSGGSPVHTATISLEMLTQDRYQEQSGSGERYCRREGDESRQRLWDELVALTGAEWP
mmetsp:Transcript_63136/g.133280  ORF Transcript_63136/g.133280 Transcript_63136/m.133280 type:complete len:272 (-) Transcript_63136:32-847(-)